MKFREPTTFLGAMSPFIIANWVFGIGIFEYPVGHPRPNISLCWSIAHVFIFLSFIALASLNHLGPWASSMISTVSWHIYLYASTVSIILFLYLGRMTSKNVFTTLRKLNAVNEMLNQYRISKEYGLTFRSQVIQLTVAFLFVSAMAARSILLAYGSDFRIAHFGYIVAAHYIPACNFVIQCTFANLIRYIGQRFQHLNANLIRNSTQENNMNLFLRSTTLIEIHANPYFVRSTDKQWMVHLIWHSRKVHQELSSAARALNEAFGVQILLIMTTSSVISTGILYSVYNSIITASSTIIEIGTLLSWVIFNAVKNLYVIYVCSMASNQAQKMGELIHQLDQPPTDRQLRTEIHAFSLQLMQNPLRFTASGFFVLDYQTIRTMIGAVVTYLVIMIQLRGTDDPQSALASAALPARNST